MTVYSSLVSRVDAGALIPEDAAREIVQGAVEGSTIMRLARRLPNMASINPRPALKGTETMVP